MLNISRGGTARFLVTTAVVVAVNVTAPPTSASVAGQATWSAPSAGNSTCVQTTTATVTCHHHYESTTLLPNGTFVETCVTAGLYVSFPPQSETYLDTCHAILDVTTSGPGKLVTANGAVCDTVAIERVGFQITTYGPYDLRVTVANNEVISVVNGREVLVDGTLAEEVSAKFTNGCGLAPPRGAFVGHFNLTVA